MRKKLSVTFVAIAFIGFGGSFFTAGAADAVRISVDTLTTLCIASVCLMAIGLFGYALCGRRE